jgi:DNA (cytosine-5)-methyltransferase 1
MSEIKYIGQMSSSQNSRVIDPEGISYAVTNGHKDGEPKIIEQKDSLVAEPNEGTAKTLCLNSKVDGKQPSLEHRIYDAEGVSTAITTGFLPSIKESTTYRIRKLTPRECFRLMGVDDKDIDTIQASGVSNSQQYKMAGNSIVVDCLYHLFRKMFTETHSEDRQLTLF